MRAIETETATELDEIWSRVWKRHALTERDFLTVARWAYHAMPAESVRSATFQLFEYAHTPRRPAAH